MKKNLFFAFFVLFLLGFSSSALALLEHQQIKVLAVTSSGQGLAADLLLEVEKGNGKVFVSSQPLVGTTTQNAANVAVELAKNYSPEVKNHDFKFSIESTASVVEGPSAGAAMALLVIAAFQDKKVPSTVALTGTIDDSGNVGQVGGVFEKSKEAANQGLKLFMIPAGEELQTIRENGQVKSINLVEYGPKELGMKIIGVATIDEALDLAFSDIDQIDIDQIISESEVPDFVPKNISYEPHLESMKVLTTNYIAETKVEIEEARNSVSSTLINDPEALTTLLSVITSAEQLMKDAEILNTQNYLYSAANFAFLARVNAYMVKDVSTNPSLLSLNSSTLDLKIAELNSEIRAFETSLEGNIPLDQLEWHISAQQRLSYAKLNLEKLANTQTIIIDGSDDTGVALQRVSDYEFAVAWVDVAKDFASVTNNAKKFVKPDSQFRELSEQLVSQAENSLTVLNLPEGAEDIERRLNAAKFENSKEWFIASAVDAATARALAESEKLVEEKSAAELSGILEGKISALEAKIKSSKHKFSWPVLYVDHSKYFLEAANYYSSSNATSRAVSSLRSGISLISLASEIFDTLEQVYTYYDSVTTFVSDDGISFPALPEVSINDSAFRNSTLPPFVFAGFLITLFSLAFIFLFLTIKMVSTPKPVAISYKKDLESVQKMKKMADEALLSGRISQEKHTELVRDFSHEAKNLEHLRKEHLHELHEIDRFRQKLLSQERKLRDLKSNFKAGALPKEEFLAHKAALAKEMAQLNKEFHKTEEPSHTLMHLVETSQAAPAKPAKAKKTAKPKAKKSKPKAKKQTKTRNKKTEIES